MLEPDISETQAFLMSITPEDDDVEYEIQALMAQIALEDWQSENDPLVIAACLPWKDKRDMLTDIYADELEADCIKRGLGWCASSDVLTVDGCLKKAKSIIKQIGRMP